MIEFIFMLTRDDRTLADAREVYASIATSGVRHVGCKDVGLPRDELAALMEDIRANGHTTHLEVVSESDEATLQSARVAAEIAPDGFSTSADERRGTSWPLLASMWTTSLGKPSAFFVA